MTRHPGPGTATVKELYGSATRCAAPGCAEPLYRFVEELGKPALNSTVAHIKAASPEGPRFDVNMSPEDNRAGPNLILLCRFHSALIDDKASDFPVELLQEWKRGQLAQGSGVEISDEQAEEVISVSITNEISMQARVINVGGSHGGGGGAIGAGAVGGPGGDNIVLKLDGRAPGGGGGALVGGGKTPPDARRAKEGVGYSDATDGGDTSMRDQDGNVLAFAPGGAAAGSPYEMRRVSDGLKISTFMLCSSIHIRDGMMFMLEGSWQSISVLNMPHASRLVIAMVVEAGGVEAGHYTIRISAHDPDGKPCGEVKFPVVIEEPGDILRITRWVPLEINLTGYGLHTLTVATDAGVLITHDLAVKRVTDAAE